jgi:hypothetical protein
MMAARLLTANDNSLMTAVIIIKVAAVGWLQFIT